MLRPESATRNEALRALGVISLLGVAYFLLALRQGAVGIPRGDDWSFLRTVFDTVTSGQIELSGWVQMYFLGLLPIAAPVAGIFNASIAALQVLTVLLTVATLWLLYLILRRILPPWLAALSVATIAFGPILGTLAVSFMTDVPAMFASMLALFVAVRVVERNWSLPLILLTAALSLWAFTIREFGILVLVALVATGLVTQRGNRRLQGQLILILLVTAALAFVLLLWRNGLVGTTPSSYGLNSLTEIREKVTLVVLAIGLMCTPAIGFVDPLRLLRTALRQRPALFAFLVAALLLGSFLVWGEFPIGNYLTVFGSYPGITVGSLDLVFLPSWIIAILAIVAVYASIILIGLLLVRSPTWTGPDSSPSLRLVQFYAMALVMLFGFMALFMPFIVDRYLLVLVPFIAALALWRARAAGVLLASRPARVFGAAGVLCYAGLGLAFVDYAAAVDGGKWAAATEAVEAGANPEYVDAGFEWFSYHQPGKADSSLLDPNDPMWWRTLYPEATVCEVVVISREPLAQASILVTRQPLFGQPISFNVIASPANESGCVPVADNS
jgi:hypothetical protein